MVHRTFVSGISGGAVGPRSFAKLVPAIAISQVALWVLIATKFQGSIENDVAEGVVDGPAWQLSYLRHPPLSSWISGLAWNAGEWRYVALYGAALTFACGAFVIVAAMTAQRREGAASVIALMCGLASPFASYWPIKFNHNIGVMPFWALTIWAAYAAFETEAFAPWALFGLSVGLGLWAKYAILHLVIPLAMVFFVKREWRRKIRTPGPWIALAICLIVISPHAIAVMAKGATTLRWAVHETPSSYAERLLGMLNLLALALLAQAPMALLAWAAFGRVELVRTIRAMFERSKRTRSDLFLHAAAFGPILVILAAGPFGVRLFYHWLTPLSVGFAAWWGRVAERSEMRVEARLRVFAVFGALTAITAVGFIGSRMFVGAVLPSSTPAYAEMDGRALAVLATDYWAHYMRGPIPYIISLHGKVAFEAAGSIAFDTPYRTKVFKEGSTIDAPWIDVSDLRQKGALVISATPIAGARIIDQLTINIQHVTAISRPLMWSTRATSPILYFGIVAPRT